MKKTRITYICWLSNPMVRDHLDLRNYTCRNRILRVFHKPTYSYSDYAIWNTDFIEEFKSFNDYEFHVVSPHSGMLQNRVDFTDDKINYHIFKCDSNLFIEAYRSYTHQNTRKDYSRIRKIIKTIVDEIKPDVIVVCGAEQPNFSPCIWDLKDIPTLVLLETAVNDPILMKVLKGSHIYGAVERRSFKEMLYFATTSEKYYQIVREYNEQAKCLAVSFPSHLPPVLIAPEKKYDFLFYSAVISKNKGVEDTILAFNKVAVKYPKVTLNICGKCDDSYLTHLQSLVSNEAKDKVSFTGFFETIDEKLRFVQSARITVLPGITAPLNSTVRESMLMGLPTILYETEVTPAINKHKQCLLCAEMQNIDDLAAKMIYAIDNPTAMAEMADNAKEYAIKNYSNRSKTEQLLNAAIAVMNHSFRGVSIPESLLYQP